MHYDYLLSIFTTLLQHEVNIYGRIALTFGVDPYYLIHLLYEFFDPLPSISRQ